ncbi:MAG: hypothetical protein L0Z50_09720, partial [Verrucomicrobiales bacterium]|nr:hypothetical protein [Verrucomicrobiales bacterium]
MAFGWGTAQAHCLLEEVRPKHALSKRAIEARRLLAQAAVAQPVQHPRRFLTGWFVSTAAVEHGKVRHRADSIVTEIEFA